MHCHRNAPDLRPITTRLLLAWLFTVLPSSWQGVVSQEETTPISALVVEPAAIEVARFDQRAFADVNVIARATGVGDLPADAKLSFTASRGLEVKIGDRTTSAGDIVWPVSVRATGNPPDASGIDFRLAYAIDAPAPGRDATMTPTTRTETDGSPIRLQRVRLAVTVMPSRNASPDADADVSIKTDFADISYGVPGRAYLLVKNKSNYPFAVEKPAIAKPAFLDVTVTPSLADQTSVPPHETMRVPLDISIPANEKSRIGEWLILASVTLSRGEGADKHTGTAVVEQKVKVGVPGVSDVLKALDLPSLLLVPGALVLATWSLLLGAGEAAKPKWLEWKSSSFWLVSITVSIIIFGIASMRSTTNFLVAYNIEDVGRLWLFCVFGSAVAFFLYRVTAWGLNSFREMRAEAERQAREPLTTDKPIAIMRKLRRANLRFYLEGYLRSFAGLEQRIFKVDFPAPDGKAWAVPQMLLRRLKDQPAARELMQQIVAANDRSADGLDPLVAALELGLKKDWISFSWEASELSGPRLLAMDQLGKAGERNSPIKVI